jgi:hypothetical protein
VVNGFEMRILRISGVGIMKWLNKCQDMGGFIRPSWLLFHGRGSTLLGFVGQASGDKCHGWLVEGLRDEIYGYSCLSSR